MNKKRVMIVFGTRPEAIKVAPVITALKADPRFEPVIVATGQHKEMVDPILNWFNIQPDHQLNVMEPGQPLAALSGKLLNGLHAIIEQERPDTLIVQGDTTTAFMATLAAYYGYDYYMREKKTARQKIDIVHLEAGLRTYNNYAPFPEEGNRRLIGHLATYHMAPTITAAEALFEENITKGVYVTGNTVIDALFDTITLLKETPRNPFPYIEKDKKIVLITGHRRESYGQGFTHICAAIRTLATTFKNVAFVYPVHLNSHVQKPVIDTLSNIENVHLIAPMDYPDFIAAMQRSYLVLTDSGGLQEEAPSLGKPVLVMRDITERPEAVIAGTSKVIGTTKEHIIKNVSDLLTNEKLYKTMAEAINPYGDGMATERILNILAGEKTDQNTFHAA